MLKPNHPIARAAAQDPQVLDRFWASVDRPGPVEACWGWHGRRSSDRYPIFTVKYHSVSAARFAWFAATGEFPIGGRLRHTCQNMDCVRPEHLEWELGRRTERMLRARSDGYVSLPGIGSAARDYGDEAWRRRRAS